MNLFIQLIIIIILLNNLHAQAKLKWINRTGTIADSIFNSRVYFHPDHFFDPITNYRYVSYSSYSNEFDANRLKIENKRFQELFNRIWHTGFLLQLCVKAEGQSDISSIAIVGKYDFISQYFPLKLQKETIDFPSSSKVYDEKLYKQANVKEPKYTDFGKVIFRLQPSKIIQPLVFLNVPDKYAERFKESVINGSIGIELIVDFQSKPNFYTKQVEKEHFLWYKKEFNISTGLAKEKYLERFREKPLELLLIGELDYKILGYRIVDGNHLILFEYFDNSVKSIKWSQDSLAFTDGDFLIIEEKTIDSSILPFSTDTWYSDAIINRYKIEKNSNSNEFKKNFNSIGYKFHSWWECDLYLKLRGRRLPSMIELREALLQSDLMKNFNGPEITSTRGHYVSNGYEYLIHLSKTTTYNSHFETYNAYPQDDIWFNTYFRYRSIIQ